MPDWFANHSTNSSDGLSLDLRDVVSRLLLSALAGALIAGLYVWKKGKDQAVPNFPFTLVMLSLLIAVVSQVIGDHIARAFSLVGALSIVRFRTVVDDTQDIAFVIFAVVVGMAIGTGNWMVAVLGLICVGGVVILSKQFWGQASSGKSSLSFKTAVGDANVDAVQSLLKDFGIQCRVIAVESARNGAILEWKYELVGSRTNRQTQELMTRLAGLEGIQAVAWKSTD